MQVGSELGQLNRPNSPPPAHPAFELSCKGALNAHYATNPNQGCDMSRVCIALLVLLFGPSRAEAMTLGAQIEELCAAADIVVVGKVTEVDPTEANGMITSEVTFDVERMIVGSNASTITIHAYSGINDGSAFRVNTTPLFVEDERYLLLLHTWPYDPPTILGLGTGAIRLSASAMLPTLQELVEEWEDVCDD